MTPDGAAVDPAGVGAVGAGSGGDGPAGAGRVGAVGDGAVGDGLPRDGLLADGEVIRAALREAIEVSRRLLDSAAVEQVAVVAGCLAAALRAGGKVIFFGNGGSASDAGHLAAELLGRFRFDRAPLAAIALPDGTAAMTAIGNDYGYDDVFARQLRALARPGDVAVGLTTSGNSGNVVRAVEAARELGVLTVVLTGASGGKVADLADHCVRVPSDDTARVQEACVHLGHTLCELVERHLNPPADR
ncbi:MAG: D-sedoheptulose 7-phosphate isomerase [Mycobacteriales bacterium]